MDGEYRIVNCLFYLLASHKNEALAKSKEVRLKHLVLFFVIGVFYEAVDAYS